MATDLKATINQNMPGILTAGSIVTQIATAGLAFYEGMKFKEDLDKLPEDATTKTKIFTVIRRVAPVILGVTAGTTMSYAAYAESTKRIAALSAAVAAAKLDKEELEKFKDKAKAVLGDEKTKEVEEEVKKELHSNVNERTKEFPGFIGDRWFVDECTGYMFKSNWETFHNNWKEFATLTSNENGTCIDEFYQMFSLDGSVPSIEAHDYIRFKMDIPFAPTFGGTLLPNGEPAITFTYDHADIYD